MSSASSPALGILIAASYFRDIVPWIYEVGVETYRTVQKGDEAATATALADFQRMIEFTLHGPWSRELIGRGKETALFLEELLPLLERAIQEAGYVSKRRRKPTRAHDVNLYGPNSDA